MIHQGDILKIAGFRYPVLVVSTDFFNESEFAIACPILPNASASPLHIEIITENTQGYVQCEDMKKIDTRARGFSIIDHINRMQVINITDAIQSIFDYI